MPTDPNPAGLPPNEPEYATTVRRESAREIILGVYGAVNPEAQLLMATILYPATLERAANQPPGLMSLEREARFAAVMERTGLSALTLAVVAKDVSICVGKRLHAAEMMKKNTAAAVEDRQLQDYYAAYALDPTDDGLAIMVEHFRPLIDRLTRFSSASEKGAEAVREVYTKAVRTILQNLPSSVPFEGYEIRQRVTRGIMTNAAGYAPL